MITGMIGDFPKIIVWTPAELWKVSRAEGKGEESLQWLVRTSNGEWEGSAESVGNPK